MWKLEVGRRQASHARFVFSASASGVWTIAAFRVHHARAERTPTDQRCNSTAECLEQSLERRGGQKPGRRGVETAEAEGTRLNARIRYADGQNRGLCGVWVLAKLPGSDEILVLHHHQFIASSLV
jgi:hypothetical protein